MDIKKEFYNKLPSDKIKINWNKNPIKMDKFLSFLVIPVSRSNNHFGSDTGWTLLENEDISLYIGGGIIQGTEYLDSLQLGEKISNPYNDYVNPFYLWEILSREGRKFFVKYYANDIAEIIADVSNKIKHTQNELSKLKDMRKQIQAEIEFLRSDKTTLA